MDEPELSDHQTKDLQNFMETEQQKAVIQAAINKLTETCFDKCVTKPGAKLDDASMATGAALLWQKLGASRGGRPPSPSDEQADTSETPPRHLQDLREHTTTRSRRA